MANLYCTLSFSFSHSAPFYGVGIYQYKESAANKLCLPSDRLLYKQICTISLRTLSEWFVYADDKMS